MPNNMEYLEKMKKVSALQMGNQAVRGEAAEELTGEEKMNIWSDGLKRIKANRSLGATLTCLTGLMKAAASMAAAQEAAAKAAADDANVAMAPNSKVLDGGKSARVEPENFTLPETTQPPHQHAEIIDLTSEV